MSTAIVYEGRDFDEAESARQGRPVTVAEVIEQVAA